MKTSNKGQLEPAVHGMGAPKSWARGIQTWIFGFFLTKEILPEISELKFQALSDPQKYGVTHTETVLVHPQNEGAPP